MNYILLFLLDGILGYALQGFGYTVAVHSINKRNMQLGPVIVMTVSFALVTYAVRNITIISSGFHTILIMILMILIATFFFKMSIYHTTLGILICSVSVLFFEVLSMFLFQITLKGGSEIVSELMNNAETVPQQITRAALGIPMNIAMVVCMLLFYRIRTKKKNGEEPNSDI